MTELNTEVLPTDEKLESRWETGVENGHGTQPNVIPIYQNPSWVTTIALLEDSGWTHLHTTDNGLRIYKTTGPSVVAVQKHNHRVQSVSVTDLFRE